MDFRAGMLGTSKIGEDNDVVGSLESCAADGVVR